MRRDSPASSPSHFSSRSNLVLALGVSALLALFAYVLIRVPDRLFADDSYFYFQVAWNFARGMGSTFNNVMPTNGYHPLWMLLCAVVFRLFPVRPFTVHIIAALIAALDVLMLLVVRQLLRRVAQDLWPVAFLLLVSFSFLSQLGTEGALSGLCLALVMLQAFRLAEAPSLGRAALFQLTIAFAVLSRLDNIFVVVMVSIAVFSACRRSGSGSSRRWQLMTLPIPAILWGTYLASNWVFFGTLQPISGLLKSNSRRDHAIGANLPHVAEGALAVILICLVVVALRKRDLFFRTVELPFALGVLLHAAYILFRMSSETRWSWYYTSWVLLAAVLLARAASVGLRGRPRLAMPVAIACLLCLAAAWYRLSYVKFLHGPDTIPPASFNEVVFRQAGIRRAFAYDQPGALAFYSDVQIVPLDGLMADLQFQRDLATKGVAAVAAKEHIDGFIGPPSPFDRKYVHDMCEGIYLSTEQFHCAQREDGHVDVTAVDVYARVPAHLAGTLPLPPDRIVWRKPDFVSVWRLPRLDRTP